MGDVAVNLDATRRPGSSGDGRRGPARRPCAARTGDVREVVSGATDLLPPGLGLRRPALAGRPHRGRGPVSSRRATGRRGRCDVPGHQRTRVAELPGLPGRLAVGRGRPTGRPATRSVVSRLAHDDQGRVLGAPTPQRDRPGTATSGLRDQRHRLARPDLPGGAAPSAGAALRGAHGLRRRLARRPRQPVDHAARPGAGAGRLAGRRPSGSTPSARARRGRPLQRRTAATSRSTPVDSLGYVG